MSYHMMDALEEYLTAFRVGDDQKMQTILHKPFVQETRFYDADDSSLYNSLMAVEGDLNALQSEESIQKKLHQMFIVTLVSNNAFSSQVEDTNYEEQDSPLDCDYVRRKLDTMTVDEIFSTEKEIYNYQGNFRDAILFYRLLMIVKEMA